MDAWNDFLDWWAHAKAVIGGIAAVIGILLLIAFIVCVWWISVDTEIQTSINEWANGVSDNFQEDWERFNGSTDESLSGSYSVEYYIDKDHTPNNSLSFTLTASDIESIRDDSLTGFTFISNYMNFSGDYLYVEGKGLYEYWGNDLNLADTVYVRISNLSYEELIALS